MTTSRITRSAIFACVLAAVPSVLEAQPSRVFVSARSGSNANSCSNVATPCQTLQGAVDQVAAGGAVLVIDTGGYGPLTINKAVSIEAPTGVEAFIHPPSGSAITVTAGANDVVILRGLTLSGGSSYGIDFLSGQALHVERCLIQGFQYGLIASRLGSASVHAAIFVEDTVIRDCSNVAVELLAIAGDVRGTIDGCAIATSSYGLLTSDLAKTAVHATVAAGNWGFGVGAIGYGRGPADLTVDGVTASNNTNTGIHSEGPSAVVRFSRSTVTGNGYLSYGSPVGGGVVAVAPAQCFSRHDSTVEGNSADLVGTIGSYTPR